LRQSDKEGCRSLWGDRAPW